MKTAQILMTFLFAALVVPVATLAQTSKEGSSVNERKPGSVLDFTMNTIDGKPKPLSSYKGKVLMVVNTASECGFTPQYETLQKLYEKYKEKGFAILAFPANNFGAQEPGSNEEIKGFCTKNYHTTFDLFEKISVKGKDQHPLYHYITNESGFDGRSNGISRNISSTRKERSSNGLCPGSINVEKVTRDVESLLAK
jgi:glutathione peroxidase